MIYEYICGFKIVSVSCTQYQREIFHLYRMKKNCKTLFSFNKNRSVNGDIVFILYQYNAMMFFLGLQQLS